MYITFPPPTCLHLFVILWTLSERPVDKFFDPFDPFFRNYEVTKFWMTRRYLNVSDTIAANEYKYHAKCGLHVNFWSFLLMSFCFMIEKVCKAKKEEFVLMATSIILNTSIIIVFRGTFCKTDLLYLFKNASERIHFL